MARLVYSAQALGDLERIVDFLVEADPERAGRALGQLLDAMVILQRHPRIGRRVHGQVRELVVAHGASGYIALYRDDPRRNLVRVLRVRHQREAGFVD